MSTADAQLKCPHCGHTGAFTEHKNQQGRTTHAELTGFQLRGRELICDECAKALPIELSR